MTAAFSKIKMAEMRRLARRVVDELISRSGGLCFRTELRRHLAARYSHWRCIIMLGGHRAINATYS